MPRQFINTYNPTTPLGAAINNLTQAFFSGPTPMEQAESQADIDYKRQLIASSRLNDESTRAEMDSNAAAAGRLGDFTGLVGQFWDNYPQDGSVTPDDYIRANTDNILGMGIGAGQEPGKLAELLLALAVPYGTDAAVARSFVGSGNAIGVNDAFSLAGRDDVANRNSDLAVSEAWSKPLSTDQVIAQALSGDIGGMTENELGVLYGLRNQPNYSLYSGANGETYAFDPYAPQPFATGVATPVPGAPVQQPLPDGTLRTVEGPTQLGLANIVSKIGSGADDGLTSSIETDMLRAAQLGIPIEDYQFVRQFEAATKNITNFQLIPQEARDRYTAIMAKITANGGGIPGIGGGDPGQFITDPLPDEAELID